MERSPAEITLFESVRSKIVNVRSQQVLLDSDVAQIYGIETRRVNEAVKNNRDKFPSDYMLVLEEGELEDLRSKFSTANADGLTANPVSLSKKRRSPTKAFTEKGLYMLATVLHSKNALNATFAIIETFAKVRQLKHEMKNLHYENDPERQKAKMNHFGELLADIVSPDLETSETESTLELNFFIGKVKHTVKRIKKKQDR